MRGLYFLLLASKFFFSGCVIEKHYHDDDDDWTSENGGEAPPSLFGDDGEDPSPSDDHSGDEDGDEDGGDEDGDEDGGDVDGDGDEDGGDEDGDEDGGDEDGGDEDGDEDGGDEDGDEDGGDEDGGGEDGGEEDGGGEDGGDEDGGDDDGDYAASSEHYMFPSRFLTGESSVSYTGQTFRHILIDELRHHIGVLDERIDSGFSIAPGEVMGELDFFFDFDSDIGGEAILQTVPENALQTVYNDISSGKNLVGKIAGNDAATDHRDWNSGDFKGWGSSGYWTPHGLVHFWFEQLEEHALYMHSTGSSMPFYTTGDGVDRQALIATFLEVAVTFSQGTDDYLDSDVDGKGLLASNTDADGGAYTTLEHSWDEGFGYFGANRVYGSMTDEGIESDRAFDFDGDEMIDLHSEYIFGAGIRAAERDLAAMVATDFTWDAWEAFYQGRTLIHEAGGELTETEMTELTNLATIATSNWEMALAATVIHYINNVRADIYAASPSSAAEFSLPSYAKNWSSAKGYALGFQFNPRSPMSDGEFDDLHTMLGATAPGWDPSDIFASSSAMTFYSDLEEARNIICDAYSFEPVNCETW